LGGIELVLARFARLVIISIGLAVTGCAQAPLNWLFPIGQEQAMMVSISTDGRYVITSHLGKSLLLWDIDKKSVEVVSNSANIYSAYFVPESEAFLWQDLQNTVRVTSLDGRDLLSFNHFPTYGHLISSDLRTYVASNNRWDLYVGFGDTMRPLKRGGAGPSFAGSGKLLNLSMDQQAEWLLSAGLPIEHRHPIEEYKPVDDPDRFSRFGGVILWNLDTLKPVRDLEGNRYKTYGEISPDGRWAIAGGENSAAFSWSLPDGERYRLGEAKIGLFIGCPDDWDPLRARECYDRSGIIPATASVHSSVFGIVFIHGSEYFLRFGKNSHGATLHRVGDPWPIKYFELGEYPKLVTYGSQYSRLQTIASSPESGTLVMAHATGGGISVYKFDPEALTLRRTWIVR